MKIEIKPHFVTFEQAQYFKRIGFDIPVEWAYRTYHEKGRVSEPQYSKMIHDGRRRELINWNLGPDFSAPEQYQIVEWLRLKHKIWVYPQLTGNSLNQVYIPMIMIDLNPNKSIEVYRRGSTPEDAYSFAFDFLKDNIKL